LKTLSIFDEYRRNFHEAIVLYIQRYPNRNQKKPSEKTFRNIE